MRVQLHRCVRQAPARRLDSPSGRRRGHLCPQLRTAIPRSMRSAASLASSKQSLRRRPPGLVQIAEPPPARDSIQPRYSVTSGRSIRSACLSVRRLPKRPHRELRAGDCDCLDLLDLGARNPGRPHPLADAVTGDLPVGRDAVPGRILRRVGVVQVGDLRVPVARPKASRIGPPEESGVAPDLDLRLERVFRFPPARRPSVADVRSPGKTETSSGARGNPPAEARLRPATAPRGGGADRPTRECLPCGVPDAPPTGSGTTSLRGVRRQTGKGLPSRSSASVASPLA